MKIVGVDPGLGGALAMIQDGFLIWVCDMPVLDKRVQANPIQHMLRHSEPDLVVIEDLHAMPRGSIASFSLGYSMGVVVATVQGLSLPLARMRPNEWKKIQGLSNQDKEASRLLATERWPSFIDSFRLKKHVDRAEAALIADAYYRKEIRSGNAHTGYLGRRLEVVRLPGDVQRAEDGADAAGPA